MENQIVLSMGNSLTLIVSFILLLGWFHKLNAKKFDRVDDETKDIRSEIRGLRTEMQEQNIQIRNEFTQLRNELHLGFSNLQNYILLGKVDKKLKETSQENNGEEIKKK